MLVALAQRVRIEAKRLGETRSLGFDDSVEKCIFGGTPQLVGGVLVCKLTPLWGHPEQVRDSYAPRWGSVPQHNVFQQSLRYALRYATIYSTGGRWP